MLLEGAFLIGPERQEDERGFFARTFCRDEFAKHGLVCVYVQSSISFNKSSLTLRGMHYQVAPSEEVKLLRCTSGAIHDVIVDLRCNSSTRLEWQAVELSASNRHMLYVPRGFAHGFLTLADNTEVEYHMSDFHNPAAARGFRWNDPTVGVRWPQAPLVISARDRSYEDLVPL
jgi:dTDP-4-dehydrorhamnose 3,5-epimerase